MTLDPSDQPVFKLGIDAASCRFEVRLNDIPILASDAALPFDVEFPVSEWIVRGPNRLAVLVQPAAVWDDDGNERPELEAFDAAESALRLTLWVKPNGAPRSQRQAITTMQFVAREVDPPMQGHEGSAAGGRLDSRREFRLDDAVGDVLVSELTFERDDDPPHDVFMFRDIGLRSPFAPWSWLRGDRIEDDDDTRDALVAEYRRVWGLLLARDTAAIEQLQRTKAAEYQAAYYLDAAQLRDAMPLADLMQSEELRLQPLGEDVELRVFGDGRLAKLVDEDGDSPVVFVRDGEVGYFVELTYCRAQGAWQLVR